MKRLTEFLRLLDYIILELQRRLVKSAVRDLLIHLRESYSVEFELANKSLYDEDDETNNRQLNPSRQKSAASSLKSIRTKGQHRSESHTTYQTLRTTMNSEL